MEPFSALAFERNRVSSSKLTKIANNAFFGCEAIPADSLLDQGAKYLLGTAATDTQHGFDRSSINPRGREGFQLLQSVV
jgi:hypothetical protein